MPDGRHEPGQHRAGKFRIPHPTAEKRGSLYLPRKKPLVVRIVKGIIGGKK